MQNLRFLLLPLSLLYYIVTSIRNILFDWKIISSIKFDIPVISVGNLTVGGTGKTPHTEYLIRLLKKDFRIAVLSRGYKRKTKGFILATGKVSPENIGDEPYQIFQNNMDIDVCVCEDRVRGINELLKIRTNTQLVLLDDAYQHRYAKPGLSILLVDYNRPIFNDFLLPAGNLRESWIGRRRADIVIVTKTSISIDTDTRKYWEKKLNLFTGQKLFFTSFIYGAIQPVFKDIENRLSLPGLLAEKYSVLIVTGIAQPKSLVEYFAQQNLVCEHLSFPDHHEFNEKDLKKIEQRLNDIEGLKKIIITTEKDAVRLNQVKNLSIELKEKMYYLPVRVAFSDGMEEEFISTIKEFMNCAAFH